MDWYQTVFELIDMRSFSNLWYWIALAAIWSSATHYVLGIPFDMVGRAARNGAQAERDLEDMVRIRVARILGFVEAAGPALVGVVALVLTVLLLLGFVYGQEFAQAVVLIALPMTLVAALSVRTAADIYMNDLAGETLRRALTRHRLMVQAIGLASVFLTALWGMYRNLNVGPLG